MGKWAKYSKKHKREWEEDPLFKGWLITNPSKDGSSFCKVCRSSLRAHRKDLEKHATTTKHKLQAAKTNKSQPNIFKFGVSVCNNSMKRKEIILASYVATHTSIRGVDHLTDLLNKFNERAGPSSLSQVDQEKFHLHKTKCSAIIKGVIAPSLLHDLIQDIGNSNFSIIVDESTDVSTEKLLCINIKYYSVRKNNVVTQFLTFLSVVETTAADLFNVIVDFFKSKNLNLKKLIGIGTDGASNLCGKNNSLYTRLKSEFELNHLMLVKCVCHSLHLCSSKASEVFADEVDFLLKETYNWFKNSPLRVSKYKQIFDLINIENNFSKLSQLSATRWLSRYRAVQKILSQYLELETFFLLHAQKERCHTAKLLCDAYQNKENKLILTFLQPILKQIYCLNLYFQKQSIDYYQAFEDINMTIWSLARQILKPPIINHLENNLDLLLNAMKHDQNYLQLDDCDLGYDFDQQVNAAKLPDQQIKNMKHKCVKFIKCLLNELINRMPTHLNVFQQVRTFSPQVILNPIRPTFSDLPLQFANPEKLGDIESQYRNLLNIQWKEEFEGRIPEDAVEFWQKSITLKNAVGELMFKDLSLFAFTMLSLPSSNATVERTFSIMNIVKSKLRNHMMLNLLNAIMTIKFHFYVEGICCKDFEPSTDMISRFTSKMYDSPTENDVTSNVKEIDEVVTFCNDYL